MSSASGWPAALELRLDGTPASLRAARVAMCDWLAAAGVDADSQDRAALVVSELATNAVEAAPGTAFLLRAQGDGDRVLITVRNHTTGSMPPRAGARPLPEPGALRGRGLAIVDTLCPSVTIETPPGEVVVTAAMPVAR